MFKTIGIFGKYNDKSVQQPVSDLANHLESRNIKVKIGDTTAEEIASALPQQLLEKDMLPGIDLAVVIGGDGTLLHVARHLAENDVPIIGINLGRLGFLTDIALNNMLEEIDSILDGNYTIEKRLMLRVQVKRKQETILDQIALNDVVIGRHALEKLIEWHSYVDDEFLTSARSDGVIISSPTGSTAYSLSAGGPILHPKLDVLTMVPISPQALSNRPIVLPADRTIKFTLVDTVTEAAHVSLDGLIGSQLQGDETILVQRAKSTVSLVHTNNYDYFAMLRAKLGWGENL